MSEWMSGVLAFESVGEMKTFESSRAQAVPDSSPDKRCHEFTIIIVKTDGQKNDCDYAIK